MVASRVLRRRRVLARTAAGEMIIFFFLFLSFGFLLFYFLGSRCFRKEVRFSKESGSHVSLRLMTFCFAR